MLAGLRRGPYGLDLRLERDGQAVRPGSNVVERLAQRLAVTQSGGEARALEQGHQIPGLRRQETVDQLQRLALTSRAILQFDDLGQEIQRPQAAGVELDGAAEVCRGCVQTAPLALAERGHQLDATILGSQPTRPFQTLRRRVQLTPLERDQAEVGPAGRLAGRQLGHVLERRLRQYALTRLRGRHAQVERRHGLRVRRGLGIRQLGALAGHSPQSEHQRYGKMESGFQTA